MTAAPNATPGSDRELSLTRFIDVPREKLHRCWTEPKLICDSQDGIDYDWRPRPASSASP